MKQVKDNRRNYFFVFGSRSGLIEEKDLLNVRDISNINNTRFDY